MSKNLEIVLKFKAMTANALNPLRTLDDKLEEARRATANFQKEVKTLTTHNTKIEALKTAIQGTSESLTKERAELSRLKSVMEQTKTPSTELTQQFNNTQKAVAKLTQTHQKQLKEIKETRAELTKACQEVKSLALNEKTLTANVNKASQALEQQQKRLTRLNNYKKAQERLSTKAEKAKGFGSNALGGAVAMGYGLKNALGAGIDFEKSLSKVQALTRLDKASKEDLETLKKLEEEAKRIGKTTKFTATQALDVQGYLAMAGFTPEEILKASGSIVNSAIATGLDPAEVSDMMSDIAGAFKKGAGEIGNVADIITFASTSSNTNLATIFETMKQAAPVFTALGQSMETTTAMAGFLGNIGIRGSDAGTALKNIGLLLNNNKALKKLGVTTKDKDGNALDVVEVLAQIRAKTAHLGTAERAAKIEEIFGKIPVAGALELIDQADGRLQKYVNQYKDIQGLTEKMAKVMSDNLGGELDGLSSAWSGLLIDAFMTVKDSLRSFTATLTEGVRWLNEFANEHKTLVKYGLITVGVITAIAGVIGGLSLAVGSIFSPLAKTVLMLVQLSQRFYFAVGGVQSLIKVFTVLKAVVLSHPIAAFITAIVLGFGLLYKYCEPFKGFIDGLADSFIAFLPKIEQGFNDLVESVKQCFTEIGQWWDEFCNKFTGLSDLIPDSIKNLFSSPNATVKTIEEQNQSIGYFNEQSLKPSSYTPIKQSAKGQTVNQTTHATININGSNLNQNELTQAVQNALQKAEAERGARLRGTLADIY